MIPEILPHHKLIAFSDGNGDTNLELDYSLTDKPWFLSDNNIVWANVEKDLLEENNRFYEPYDKYIECGNYAVITEKLSNGGITITLFSLSLRNHNDSCGWWKDWHSCNCGLFDQKCQQVIPETYIICGEDNYQYCSKICYIKSRKNT